MHTVRKMMIHYRDAHMSSVCKRTFSEGNEEERVVKVQGKETYKERIVRQTSNGSNKATTLQDGD